MVKNTVRAMVGYAFIVLSAPQGLAHATQYASAGHPKIAVDIVLYCISWAVLYF